MSTIVVAGDLLCDYNLVQQPAVVNYHHEALQKTVLHHQPGGAWYLADMLRLACPEPKFDIREPKRPPRKMGSNQSSINRAYSIWSLHERGSTGEDKKKRVWRIQKFLGCESAEKLSPVPIRKDRQAPAVLALDDLNLRFRHQPRLWPAALQVGGNPTQIVIKTTPPFDGPLWEKLLETELADRLTVVLPVTSLRTRQATISQALSWDRTIDDIIEEFTNGVSARDLGRCRRVIVHFNVAGAASFTRDPLPRAQAQLLERVRFERFVYHPDELEGSWRNQHPGLSFGATSVLVAALVRYVLQPTDYPLFVALTHGLTAMKEKHVQGGGDDDKQFNPKAAHEKMKEVLSPTPAVESQAATKKGKDERPERIYCAAYPRELLSGSKTIEPAKSTLLLDVTGPGFEYVAAKAMEVVLRGPKVALRVAPKASYGKYQTVDHEEIERINIIRNMIIAYQRNERDERPLSIAVFGSPGSGKSFAIKELASELFGKDKKPLEFNLSQFQGVSELHRAFHQVRDESVQGRIPLVFWDEFDAARQETRLGWLKEFLMPMQDAKFQAGSLTHSFGKAIFVFAGGTHYDFQSFEQANIEDRTAKAPDFISRLRGFVNIKGPNPVGQYSAADESKWEQCAEKDPAFLIRRAMLLRTFIERSYERLIEPGTEVALMSESVVERFLRVKRYLHGARSLEAIVHTSALSEARYFGVSELPPEELLRLHVTSDFSTEAANAQLNATLIEAIAKEIHKRWKRERESKGWRLGEPRDNRKKLHPLLKPYEELAEEGKELNRQPARLTRAKLAEIGYCIVPLSQAAPFKLAGKVEKTLKQIEHDIWMREHLSEGYEWAARAKSHLRLHPDILPSERLTKAEQKLVRANIESTLHALQALGFTFGRIQFTPQNRTT